MSNKIEKLSEIINDSTNIVFFGGAGVSTESNIPDFRSADGLYNRKLNKNYTPEEVLSHNFFITHPDEFYEFYKSKMLYKDAKPNKAHFSLAKLEKEGKLNGIITQNIDGLHQMAGSKNVLELHGSIHRNHCTKCKKFYTLDELLAIDGLVPKCTVCGGIIKPDVVLYEEPLDDDVISKSINLISQAEILIVGGTSLVVYPAASFIQFFKGKNLILINKSKTQYDNMADLIINAPIGEVLNHCI